MKRYTFLIVLLIFFHLSMKSEEPFWQKLDNASKWDIRDISFDRFGSIYTAGGGGAYKSTDNGLTWRSLGLEGDHYFHIFIDNFNYLFIASSHLLRSKDTGSSWEDITANVGWSVYDRGIIMNKRNHLFVGEFRTTDHGDTWTNEYQYLGCYYSYAMNSEGHIFRGGSGYQETICRSTDDGDTWEVVFVAGDKPGEAAMYRNMIFNPKNTIGYAFFKTNDNGRNWYERNKEIEPAGLPLTIDSLYNFYSAVSSFSNPIYYKYIYKSIKDSTWIPMDTSGLNGVDEFNTMATSPNGYIFLAAHNGGLYRSRQAYVSAPDTPPAEHSTLSISPNPASDYIEINLERWSPSRRWTPSEIKIYNSLGQCVLSPAGGGVCAADGGGNPLAFGEGPGVRLDISNLPIGLYFISLNNGKRALTGSFIILR